MTHTPLSDAKLQELAEGKKKKPVSPITVGSAESGPIVIEQKPPADHTPEAVTTEEASEQETSSEQPQAQQYVEENPEDIDLPPELKNLGLKTVKKNDFPDYRNVELPISDEKVMMGSKAPMNSSLRWLAEFAKFLLWRAHITLKTVHGRVIRVIKK